MPETKLLMPPRGLAQCLLFGVFRDTRGAGLADADRLNYFPASPLYAASMILRGTLHLATGICDLETVKDSPRLPQISTVPPQPTPVTSWSPGDITALTLGIYPDAWTACIAAGTPLDKVLAEALADYDPDAPIAHFWDDLCQKVLPIWDAVRSRQAHRGWLGSDRMADWARHTALAAALSGPGRSLRAAERRFRRWTGQSQQDIRLYARVEALHALTTENPDVPMAALADDAQFSDQSHMGRAVKRVTGYPPARLNHLIATEEAFWCYRLLGERF